MRWAIAPFVVAVLLFIAGPLDAGSKEKETEVVRNAVEVLEDISAIPEKGIPPTLLQNAYGIAVVPGVIKIGFVVGGRHGRGVVLVRDDRGGWSNPVFISLTGGSVGWQIGVITSYSIHYTKLYEEVE